MIVNMDDRHIGCNFSVVIEPIELKGNFSAVSGLGAEIAFEEYHEGGNFTSPVLLPTGVKYSNIVLQRGTMSLEPLSIWFSSVMAGLHQRYPMNITMMDREQKPVKIWTVMEAMPIRIDYSEMNALSGSVSVTTIELIHGEIIYVM